MNKLEEQIRNHPFNQILTIEQSKAVSKVFVSLTKDIAVKFAEWLIEVLLSAKLRDKIKGEMQGKDATNENLFDYFITNIYKP